MAIRDPQRGMDVSSEPMDASLICSGFPRNTSALFVGSYPHEGAVQRSLVDVIVGVAEEHVVAAAHAGIDVLNRPLKDDGERPIPEERRRAELVAREVADMLRAGERVLVACELGLNRSAWVAGMALLLLGIVGTGRAAVETLEAKRGPQVFTNNPYMRRLLEGFVP